MTDGVWSRYDDFSNGTHGRLEQRPLTGLELDTMALGYKNWCCGTAADNTLSARYPRPAMLRGHGCVLPLRTARYSKGKPTALAPFEQHRSLVALRAAAPVADAGAAVNSSSNGNGSHDNHYEQPVLHPSTLTVHGGENNGRLRQGVADSLTTPIIQTSTYTFKNTAELIAYQEGRHGSYEYGRYGNPTSRVVEEKIMALEGAEDCLLSSSGMCSATTMLLALVPAGGHIVTTTDCYRRTRQFIQTVLPKMGISCTVIDPSDLQGLQRALEQHQVSLFFSESPTNPYLRCVDIRAITKMCEATNTIVCVDSTFATPVNSRALSFGADLVTHSATKDLAGHNDVLAGAICWQGRPSREGEVLGCACWGWGGDGQTTECVCVGRPQSHHHRSRSQGMVCWCSDAHYQTLCCLAALACMLFDAWCQRADPQLRCT